MSRVSRSQRSPADLGELRDWMGNMVADVRCEIVTYRGDVRTSEIVTTGKVALAVPTGGFVA